MISALMLSVVLGQDGTGFKEHPQSAVQKLNEATWMVSGTIIKVTDDKKDLSTQIAPVGSLPPPWCIVLKTPKYAFPSTYRTAPCNEKTKVYGTVGTGTFTDLKPGDNVVVVLGEDQVPLLVVVSKESRVKLTEGK